MMLGSCTKLKETLNHSIYNICSDIDSYVYNPGKDYSRVRKLPAENVISYLISQGGSSTKKDVVRYSYDPAGNLTEENYHTASGAWKIWRRDSRKHASPNSAQTESACAGSLGMAVCLSLLYFL